MPLESLAEFELLVMLAALRLGAEEAYTVSIADDIQRKTGRSVRRAGGQTGRRARCDGGRRRFTTAQAAARLSVGKPTFARGRFSDSRFGRAASLLVVTQKSDH